MAAAPQTPNSVPKVKNKPITFTTAAGIGSRVAAPPRIARLPPKRGSVLKGIASCERQVEIKPTTNNTAGGIEAGAVPPRIGQLPPKRGRVLKGIPKMMISALCFHPCMTSIDFTFSLSSSL
ncbi:hypothetical protein NE237_007617 [Protea cynaroides]|uniref:Uncharacterized protein n=1 Tax=Protea cynaroides TaxID=273540 RepID=A0A9Q0QWD6_9MAGN|nr:hypothetical protein NE237_007617 [Protea cynaroides]